MKKILFISHDLSRSGAPLMLLGFMQWLKEQHPQIRMDLIALRGGELQEDFQEAAHRFWRLPSGTIFQKLKKKLTKLTPEAYPASFLKKIAEEAYEVVYANTINAVPLATELKKRQPLVRCVAHIHELQTTMDLLQPELKNFLPFVDQYLSASSMVTDNLVESYGVPRGQIKTVYVFTREISNGEKTSVKTSGDFVVGASGTFHWRKGGDVFLQVVRYIALHQPSLPIRFKWVGALPEHEKLIAQADLRKMGLEDRVEFTGLTKEPLKHFREMDVFLLTSREDPFPIACVEAGMLGKPVVCFHQATGIEEVLEKGGGFSVPYLDVKAMAEKALEYYTNSQMKKAHGRQIKENFSFFTEERVCPAIYEIINQSEGEKSNV